MPISNQTPEDIVYITSKKISQELRNSEPEIKKPLNLSRISGIKKAASELQKYIEEIDNNASPDDDIVVGGSSATFTQMKKFRVPKDLDISTPYLNKEVRNIAIILRNKYGANNVVITPKIRVMMGGKDVDVVQIKIKGNNGKLIDAADIKHEVDDGFMSVNVHPKIKIGNMYVEPLGYLIERKAIAIKEKYRDKIKQGVVPKARARKDIDDFRVMTKSVPDFHKKNLQLYMTEFENNLVSFNKIPKIDAPKTMNGSVPVIGGFSDPFGTSGFFLRTESVQMPPRKKKSNPLQIQGFKLW
jgi:hypothetical protein